MRINRYVASATDLSRRAADAAITAGRVSINDSAANTGGQVSEGDIVKLDGKVLAQRASHTTIMLNKPVGYVCSRNGQGSKTIYELLPSEYQHLQPVGRLDKDSSGLLVLTDDGELANELTHPRYHKTKVYKVTLDKPLEPLHQQMISDKGILLEDGLSRFEIQREPNHLVITMHEGRNRQIRRTFESLGNKVKTLHRTQFGEYNIGALKIGTLQRV